ncbi:MAG: hypothetical protein AAF514_13590 [Verrucomicrobiota bacterium]
MIKSAAPDSDLSRAELLLTGSNLTATGVVFEDLGEIQVVRQGDGIQPKVTLETCSFICSKFPTKLLVDRTETTLTDLSEADASRYDLNILEEGPLPEEGVGLVAVQIDNRDYQIRIFDFQGEEIADSGQKTDGFFTLDLRNFLTSEEKPAQDRIDLVNRAAFLAGLERNALIGAGLEVRFVDVAHGKISDCDLPRSTVIYELDEKGSATVADNVLAGVRGFPSRRGLSTVGGINSETPLGIGNIVISGNRFSGLLASSENGVFLEQIFGNSVGSVLIQDNRLSERSPAGNTYKVSLSNLDEDLAQGAYAVSKNRSVGSLILGVSPNSPAYSVAAIKFPSISICFSGALVLFRSIVTGPTKT